MTPEESPPNHHLQLLFQLLEQLIQKLEAIRTYEYPKIQTVTYIGYDERDAADYNTEGYQALEEEKQQLQQLKDKLEHEVEVYLMILYQIFYVKNDTIMIQIEENRDTLLTPASAARIAQKLSRVEEVMIPKLISICEALMKFSLNHSFQANERITSLCLKIIILISAQFPLLSQKTTEVSTLSLGSTFASSRASVL